MLKLFTQCSTWNEENDIDNDDSSAISISVSDTVIEDNVHLVFEKQAHALIFEHKIITKHH